MIVHDPQTGRPDPGDPRHRRRRCWRCHVGLDEPDDIARRAWEFLVPYVRDADAYVFSREAFEWEGLDTEVTIIAPSIDAFAPKNQELDRERVASILTVAGLIVDGGAARPTFTREDGSPAASTAPLSAGSAPAALVATGSWSRSRAGTRSRTRSG